jgi:hypothetical protein
MIDRLWKFFTSLRLTVVCLGFGIVLVFLGTIAQVNEGLWQAQARWFKSFFIWWGPAGAGWQIPVLPGGYLVGIVLVLNLLAAHIKRFQFTKKQFGINLTHLGIILLLVGQLVTDLMSQESTVSLREGETRNFVESHRENELVFLTDVDAGQDTVVSIPEEIVAKKGEITHPKLPFTVRVKDYALNGSLRQRAPMVDSGPPPATQGVGPKVTALPQPEVKTTDERNLPYAVVEIVNAGASLGTWLVSPFLDQQEFKIGDKTWRVALRFEREYTPFSVKLLKTTHEVYRGTEIPKNFQSRVRIENPRTSENREVDIYMNNPLRYEGLTFYQYQMGRDERAAVGTSTLQVVRNPSWLTPYFGCAIVALGLIYQFLFHLVRFITKRRAT